MKVVADTNVLVSALIFPGGAPELVYCRVLGRELELVSSRPLLAELGRVLGETFGWDAARVEQSLLQLRLAEIVEPRETILDIETDPSDNRVLEAAAEARAEAIVSGDRHLLALGSWRRIPVTSPAELQQELQR